MDQLVSFSRHLVFAYLAIALLCVNSKTLRAATCTWVGSAGVPAWSAAANWSGKTTPTTNDMVSFSASSVAQLSSTCDISGLSIFQIIVTDVASAVTINGTIGSLGDADAYGGIDMSSAKSDLTVNARIGMNGTGAYRTVQDWNVAASRTLIVAGAVKVIDGACKVRKRGSGLAQIAGVENNDGFGLAVTAGILELAKTSGANAHSTTGVSAISSGATLRLAGSGGDQIDDSGSDGVSGISGTFDLNGRSETIGWLQGDSTTGVVTNYGSMANSVLTVANTVACTFAGRILDGASYNVCLTKSGSATLTLGGTASTYTGITRIENGTLVAATIASAGAASTLGYGSTAASGEIEIDGGTYSDPSLQYTGSSVNTNRRFALGRGKIEIVGSAANLQLTGAVVGIASTSPCEKIGAGTLTLGGTTNNDSLSMKISAGILILAKTVTAAHAIDGAGDALFISSGTVQLAGSGGDQINNAGGISASGGTLDLNGRSETVAYVVGSGGTVTNSVASTSTLTIGGFSGEKTFAGLLSESSSAVVQISKCGSGDWILSNASNTFTGGVTISGGTLSATSVANSGTASALGKSGTITLAAASGNSATLQFLGLSGTTDRTVRIAVVGANSISVIAGGSLALTGSVSAVSTSSALTKLGGGALSLQGTTNNSSLTLAAQSGTVSLAKTSSSTVHAAVAVTAIASGATVMLAGTGGDQILDAGYVQISGGAFDLNGKSEAIDRLLGASGKVTNSASAAGVLSVGASDGSSQFSGDVSGNLKLVKTGAGAAAFGGSVSVGGGLVVESGTMTAQTISAVGTSVSVKGTATLTVSCLIADSLILGGATAANASVSAEENYVATTVVPEPCNYIVDVLTTIFVIGYYTAKTRRRRERYSKG